MAGKLYRSNRDKKLGGVCSGLAEYFAIDVTLVRLLWALTVLLSGFGLFAYIIAWIIIPEGPDVVVKNRQVTTEQSANLDDAANIEQGLSQFAGESETKAQDNPEGRKLAGIILIALGVMFLLRLYLPPLPWAQLWPVILIIVGLSLILGWRGRKGEDQD